jgi:hypothetical protein
MTKRSQLVGALASALLLAVFSVAGGPAEMPQSDDRKSGSAATDRTSDDGRSADQASENPLRMSRGVVCRDIDGFEAYDPLPGAALTSDEKLLVYYRPAGYTTALIDGYYRAHFTQDAQVRKRGEKAVLRHKKNLLDYYPRSEYPPQNIYLRNTISLKGLAPGDYDLTIILRDELAKGPPAMQVVKFRVIPAQDPLKTDDAKPPTDPPKSP